MAIYIVDIEAVDTRYTKQWKEHLPNQLKKSTNEQVITISGGEIRGNNIRGVSNFGGTNIYKSKQLEQIGEMFRAVIKDGDYFPYNPMLGISQLYNYVTWQSYWVLAFALVVCGMLVVMIPRLFRQTYW